MQGEDLRTCWLGCPARPPGPRGPCTALPQEARHRHWSQWCPGVRAKDKTKTGLDPLSSALKWLQQGFLGEPESDTGSTCYSDTLGSRTPTRPLGGHGQGAAHSRSHGSPCKGREPAASQPQPGPGGSTGHTAW